MQAKYRHEASLLYWSNLFGHHSEACGATSAQQRSWSPGEKLTHGHYSVPFFPEEDAKLRATKLQIRRGGNVGNSLEVLQCLLRREKQQNEVNLHLIACLPNETSLATGKVLSSFGHGSAIDFSRCLYRADKTEAANCYILRSRSSGSRTIVNFNDLEEMTLPEFIAVADQFREEPESWWHFEVSNIDCR
jgi:ketohexokinase